MSAILDKFFYLINGSFGDFTTGINHIKYSLLSKYWLADVLKVLSDLDISKGRQSIVLSAKWLVVV
jgi:hypothetical protein